MNKESTLVPREQKEDATKDASNDAAIEKVKEKTSGRWSWPPPEMATSCV